MLRRIFTYLNSKVALCALSAFTVFGSPSVGAQETQSQSILESTKSTVITIADQGKWDLYISGYARHFARQNAGNLNEKAWGLGIGKTFRNHKGNDESLFFLANRDSNSHAEYAAGYMHQWIFPASTTGLEFGAGLATFIISRKDMFSGTPFPAVLPIVSIGTKRAKLIGMFAPYKPDNGKRSGVVLVFGKLEFN